MEQCDSFVFRDKENIGVSVWSPQIDAYGLQKRVRFMFMIRVFYCLCLVAALVAAGGCPAPPPDQDGQIQNDASPTDQTPDTPKADTAPAEKPAGKSCMTSRDCPGADCVKNACVKAEACSDSSDCPDTHICFDESHCVLRCLKDTMCEKGYVCTNGICHKPEWKTGKAPNEGNTQKQPLKVGVGVSKLDFPLGVSMAGYGFRRGATSPYAQSLGASTGMYDRFDVKAVMLDNNVERLVLIRSPLIFSTDYLVTQVIQGVIEKTGVDYTGKLILTSTHSHSAPARFWNLLPGLGFGLLGGGDFMPEVFSRLRDSFVNAIVNAEKSLEPGKVGYAIDPNFDPENLIFSDRRGENPNYKEPRLMVMKVEKADGTPIAVVVNFPMHGTINPFESSILTNDAAGGLEFKLQDTLEALEKKRIEVMFMQGAAGDVSPRGDRMGHKTTQQMQMLGTLASAHIEKLYKTIKTSSDVELEITNKRVPITYEDLGYKNGEFYTTSGGGKTPYRFGAFQCVEKGTPADQPPTHKDGSYGCLFSVENLNGAAIPQFNKTRLTAARIGGLVIATFPGENTSHLARRLREGVEKQTNGALKDIVVFGYSQDHQLYIVGETDWFHGGYEASTSIWGPKAGEYLLKNAIELTSQLATKEKEANDTGILPIDFYKLDLTPIAPRKETPGAGTIEQQPAKEYMRMGFDSLSFILEGGYFGIDNPHVVLQKEANGTFEDVKRTGDRLYDEFDYRIIMTFREFKGRSLYTYSFAELQDFPTGKYRFRIEGSKWDGSKRVPYTATTDAFDIIASDQIKLWDVTLDGKEIKAWASYPASSNDDGKSELTSLQRKGHRLRSSLVPWEVGGPMPETGTFDIKVTIAQGGNTVETLTLDKMTLREKRAIPYVTKRDKEGKETTATKEALASGFNIPTTQTLAAGTYQVTIEFKDPYGNTGKWGPKDVTVK